MLDAPIKGQVLRMLFIACRRVLSEEVTIISPGDTATDGDIAKVVFCFNVVSAVTNV